MIFQTRSYGRHPHRRALGIPNSKFTSPHLTLFHPYARRLTNISKNSYFSFMPAIPPPSEESDRGLWTAERSLRAKAGASEPRSILDSTPHRRALGNAPGTAGTALVRLWYGSKPHKKPVFIGLGRWYGSRGVYPFPSSLSSSSSAPPPPSPSPRERLRPLGASLHHSNSDPPPTPGPQNPSPEPTLTPDNP